MGVTNLLNNGKKKAYAAPGTRATVDDQGDSNTCTSHALGKAITECFDDLGYDVKQAEITNTVVNHNKDINARFATDFHGMTGHQQVQKKSQFLGQKKKKTWLRWTPVIYECTMKDFVDGTKNGNQAKQGRFIIDYGQPDHGSVSPHCVFAQEFKKGKVKCINSWGGKYEHPEIKPGKVYTVYRVALVLKNPDNDTVVARTNLPEQDEKGGPTLLTSSIPGMPGNKKTDSGATTRGWFSAGLHGLKSLLHATATATATLTAP